MSMRMMSETTWRMSRANAIADPTDPAPIIAIEDVEAMLTDYQYLSIQ